MKPWIKRTLFSLLVASILVGSLTACGQQCHVFGSNVNAEDQARMRGKIIVPVAGTLDLIAEQKQRLNVLADKQQEPRGDHRAGRLV